MARSKRRRRWPNIPRAAAELVDRFGWSPVALLNTIDRLTPGRGDRARKVGDGVSYGPLGRQTLDIWAPTNPDTARLPVMIFFYGGGWHAGERGDYGFAGAAFAGQGLSAWCPTTGWCPRSATRAFSRTRRWRSAGSSRHIAEYGGDPAKITVGGHSAGAYIAAMLALDPRWLDAVQLGPDTHPRRRAAVGTVRFRALSRMARPRDLRRLPRPVGNPADQSLPRRRAAAAAPAWQFRSPRLCQEQPNLDAALKGIGAASELIVYKGCDHAGTVVALSRPFRGRHPVLADAVRFLRSVLGFPPPRQQHERDTYGTMARHHDHRGARREVAR